MPDDIVHITSPALSVEIATLGAELQRLTCADGKELLWNGDPAVWRGRAPILFPVIGMLNGGQYRLDGKSHAMPKHGFARDSVFEVVTQERNRAVLRLCANPATLAFYPFQFRLDVEFSLSGNSLIVTATIANEGDTPMPASFGFHPAFCWPLPFGARRDDHVVRFEQAEPQPVRRIDGGGLLTPDHHPTPVAGNELRLRDTLFVDDALIFDAILSRSVRYGTAGYPGIQVDFPDFPMLGIWTKPGAGFVCIEPWQGVADPRDFTDEIWRKPGIIAIPAGETRHYPMTVSVIRSEPEP